MATRDFLLEIGTEELPPIALEGLSRALESSLCAQLSSAGLDYSGSARFATPRRLAVLVSDLGESQPDRTIERFGPAVSAAFDSDGKATPAALGFARSCGVSVDALARADKDGVEKLLFHGEEKGAASSSLLPAMVQEAVNRLPVPKPMRWGIGREEFVRPVHWIVMLFGSETLSANILGQAAGNQTWGHRFHHNVAIALSDPGDYEKALDQARVIASFSRRRDRVRELVIAQADQLGARAAMDEALLNEVTGLVEFPVALTGTFDVEFLEVPPEVLVLTMKTHQKCFCVEDRAGKLLPNFIVVSNLESTDPSQVIEGNERVIRPRLADARFFFEQDKKHSLASRLDALSKVTFQEQLGSVADKSSRVTRLAADIAAKLGLDEKACIRAAELAKCDLLTDMVNEFADLQGLMGYYYALHDGESEQVARAIDEQYMPRFAGDSLPQTEAGLVLAVAEKLDTITGLFAINQPPTGSKDPFALRRYGIGLLRILVEKELDLDIVEAIKKSLSGFKHLEMAEDVGSRVYEFLLDRFKAWYADAGITAETFHAVMALKPSRPLDFDKRIRAVAHFTSMAEAESLIAANKRVSNILDKATVNAESIGVKPRLLSDPAEKELFSQIQARKGDVAPLFEAGDYIKGMELLAGLKPAVDKFFDEVLVMAEDEKIRSNRLALLHGLRALFLSVADISELHVA